MLGGDIVFIFLCFLFYLCLCSYFKNYDTLVMIYIMRLFMVYVFFLFLFCENKKFIWFTCIFHTCFYVLFSVSRICRLIHSKLLSTFAIDR